MEAFSEPDPDRLALFRSVHTASDLHAVATAIAVAIEKYPDVYVEHTADGWRWSPVTGGGPYPLLRIVALFLKADHHRILFRFRTIDGRCLVDPESPEHVDWHAFLVFEKGTPVHAVAAELEHAYRER